MQDITLTVNGKDYTCRVTPGMKLIELLRDNLGLTGTKNGCAKGVCGSCTVIMDGSPVRSCTVQAESAQGRHIETIEHLSDPVSIHSIQYAFIKEGAVQCGFCTPGMIMRVKALLDRNPQPTRQDVRKALTGNLCRCTGYQPIFAAVASAAEMLGSGITCVARERIAHLLDAEEDLHSIGISMLDRLVIDKVTGVLRYGDDHRVLLQKDGSRDLLFGRILYSDESAADFTLDTSEAERMPGVSFILTADDIPGENRMGMIIDDQPVFAAGSVRCIGDPIAAVIAESEAAAKTARDKIRVSYTPKKGVFSTEEALSDGAEPVQAKGNICHEAHLRRGNPEQCFTDPTLAVVADTFKVPPVDPGFLEPESGFGWMDHKGRIIIEMATQSAFDDRRQLARILNLREEMIIIRQLPMGGAFGAKEDITLQAILAIAVRKSGRKVQITLSREESFAVHPKRHAATMRYRMAADREGKFIALSADITADTGAYASLGPDILENMLTFGAGPYEIQNLDITGKLVYTNNPMAGAMRGFGVPQVAFAVEQLVDRLAGQLGIHPLEIRRKNALAEGSLLASGQRMEAGIAVLPTINNLESMMTEVMVPEDYEQWQYGLGFASAMKNVGFGHGINEEAGARIFLERGSVRLFCGTFEYGQGSLTALAQIAAETLGLPATLVDIQFTETEHSPETGATTASRQTYLSGNAVIGAAEELKRLLCLRACELHGGSSRDWHIRDGKLINSILPAEIKLDDPLIDGLQAEFRYQAPETGAFAERPDVPDGQLQSQKRTHWAYTATSQAVLVRVHRDSSKIEIRRIWAVQECGRALNPLNVHSQVVGGVVQGMGYALQEEVLYNGGKQLTRNFDTYHMPRAGMIPEIEVKVLEIPDPNGPFGAKGMGEIPILATAPAIANAVHDATGCRHTTLPLAGNRRYNR